MKRKDIIEIANEVWEIDSFPSPAVLKLIKFANLVAAHERDECAKVCEAIDVEYKGEDVLATWCAAAIRARGKK